MAVAEAWVASSQIVLLLAVAAVWMRGPGLGGTKGWGAALLVLNAVAILGFALVQEGIAPAEGLRHRLASWIDRVSDVALLALTLVICRVPRPWSTGAITVAVVAIALVTPHHLLASQSAHPAWVAVLRELPLEMAIIGLAPALAWRVRQPSRVGWPAVLILSALALRYANVASLYWSHKLWTPPPPGTWELFGEVPAMIACVSLGSLLIYLVGRLYICKGTERDETAALCGALVVGLLYGIALKLGVGELSTATFTMGYIRPAAFLLANRFLADANQNVAMPAPEALVGALLASLAAVWGASAGWQLPTPAALLISSAAGIVSGGAIWLWMMPTARAAADVKFAPDVRVPLPDDWDLRVRVAMDRFQGLAAETQARVRALRRWERLLLAVDAASSLPPRAFERTTPGLHLISQAPYAQIGPELKRANGRRDRIVADLGLGVPDGPLWRTESGGADGLASKRALRYDVLPAGAAVATAIRERLGLERLPREEIAQVAGEYVCGAKTQA